MIDTPAAMPNSEVAAVMSAVYVPLIVFMVWVFSGTQLRRWWRRRKLNIPEREENLRTINGPLWEVGWIKVSEVEEKYPEEQRSTVLGNDLPQVVRVLKAKFGDEFEGKTSGVLPGKAISMSSWGFRERKKSRGIWRRGVEALRRRECVFSTIRPILHGLGVI